MADVLIVERMTKFNLASAKKPWAERLRQERVAELNALMQTHWLDLRAWEVGRGLLTPQNLDGSPTFYVAFRWGRGNRLRQTGYTFLKKIPEKGSNTPDQEIGPRLFKTCLRGKVSGRSV